MATEAWVQDGEEDRWLRFAEPVAVLAAASLDEVRPVIAEAAARVEAEGLFAAGFLAYEAAPAFDPALAAHPAAPATAPPLAWFALFRRAEPVAGLFAPSDDAGGGGYTLGRWRPSLGAAGYRRAITAIKGEIARGETYQVNFTYRLTARFAGDPRALTGDLVAAQRSRWGAYLDLGRFAICSASPELFFALDGDRLSARPMKGTARRGLGAADDRERAARLRASPKERAENLMIVDMMRNDLGRVAVPGTVAVPELFAVERYPTVLQMTSTVVAESRAPVPEIVAALFPCASITGAPKARTTAIIARLEGSPRGVYTGAIGYLAPGRRARFSVAIRTAVVDRQRGEATYGVGGGILWDSVAAVERRECELKAQVLTAAAERGPWGPCDRFELLETMRWTPGEGFADLAHHLARLSASAEYFGFTLDLGATEARLAAFDAERGSGAGGEADRLRVRLLADVRGRLRLEAAPLDGVGGDGPDAAANRPVRLGVAPAPVDPDDPFLYHKTTRRRVYEEALAARPGCDDVLLWNPRGEATESCVANLVVDLDGEWLTPPVACGLLPGTRRARLLAEGRVRERVVALADLDRSRAIYLVSSLRGWRRVERVEAGPANLDRAAAYLVP